MKAASGPWKKADRHLLGRKSGSLNPSSTKSNLPLRGKLGEAQGLRKIIEQATPRYLTILAASGPWKAAVLADKRMVTAIVFNTETSTDLTFVDDVEVGKLADRRPAAPSRITVHS